MSIKRNPYPILEKEHGDFDEKYSFDTELINASVENGIFKFHFNAEFNEPNLIKLQSKKSKPFIITKPLQNDTIAVFTFMIIYNQNMISIISLMINIINLLFHYYFNFTTKKTLSIWKKMKHQKT